MFTLAVPWWELVLRALIVFSFLLIALRATGKRHMGQLAPFDLVLLLILSNAVQNSMNAGDNSLLGGLISAATLLLLDYIFGWITFKNKKASRIIEGQPQILVHNGKVFEKALTYEKMTREELETAIRKEGLKSVLEVEYAILENNGGISIIPKRFKEDSQ